MMALPGHLFHWQRRRQLIFKRGKLHVTHIHCRQLFNMVLTVTQITVDLGHVRYPFFNFQFAGNTIRAERNRKIRIIFTA